MNSQAESSLNINPGGASGFWILNGHQSEGRSGGRPTARLRFRLQFAMSCFSASAFMHKPVVQSGWARCACSVVQMRDHDANVSYEARPCKRHCSRYPCRTLPKLVLNDLLVATCGPGAKLRLFTIVCEVRCCGSMRCAWRAPPGLRRRPQPVYLRHHETAVDEVISDKARDINAHFAASVSFRST